MPLILRPRAAPGDRIRLWIAALARTSPPSIAWTIDGRPAVPTALQSLTSARPPALVDAAEPRAFTGVYEFLRDGAGAPIRPRTQYLVGATATDGDAAWPLLVQTLPAEVPDELDGQLNIMLVSCFHAKRDATGIAGKVASLLPSHLRPDLTLLLGDQVYLDLPTISDFHDDERWLARRFEESYLANWAGDLTAGGRPAGYSQVLAAAPTIAMPDDHDFWNNFPHPAPHIENTWNASGRARWHAAALAMYEAFQLPLPGALGDLTTITIPPVSIACLDTRSHRVDDRSAVAKPSAVRALRAWADGVAAAGHYGFVATGQSLYDPRRSKLEGTIGDFTLPNYGDFDTIVDHVLALTAGGRPATCITGDVHWGRVTATSDRATGQPVLYEVICSPAALVETIGLDNLKGLGAGILKLFGHKPDWPLHGKPSDPPELFVATDPRTGAETKYQNRMLHGQKGNQIAILSLARAGSALRMRITYCALHEDPKKAVQVPVAPITLNVPSHA